MLVTRPLTVISPSRVGSSGYIDVKVMATEATGSVAAAGTGITTRPNTEQSPETATASSTRAARAAHPLLT
jgi:hypothetical protein